MRGAVEHRCGVRAAKIGELIAQEMNHMIEPPVFYVTPIRAQKLIGWEPASQSLFWTEYTYTHLNHAAPFSTSKQAV